jgi:hypothetical protein
VVSKVAAGDDSEGPDGGQGAGLGAAHGVDAVAVPDVLAVGPAGEVYASDKDVARMTLRLRAVAFPGTGTLTVSSISSRALGGLALAAATSSERAGVVIVA